MIILRFALVIRDGLKDAAQDNMRPQMIQPMKNRNFRYFCFLKIMNLDKNGSEPFLGNKIEDNLIFFRLNFNIKPFCCVLHTNKRGFRV